ncbi:tRNA (adenosine(37)-N6)-threonylcarbamoyltransferase complex ATPase subunit type 1 TsaE [bacterium D16-51]|nr:tRNA (adenosine(37)-N6)-threonylcarbamoyltransferase complex ATPase subunit type 1 TsaE [bacterium D16-59]RKI58346.1 tRNA (adenosine(37)-N6)-threonylcarbamoyltransferase complex ATPase subunit type 1 TsaE [bacterium D16-51]
MSKKIYESWSAKETLLLGSRLGKSCKAGDVILLNGDLGVGKTVFSKGIGEGLGIAEPISSPTFTILQVYEGGRLPFYHFDVYRIADIEEMEEIGYEDYFYGDGVCLIEWAGQIQEILPDKAVTVTVAKNLEKGFDYRKIVIEGMDIV